MSMIRIITDEHTERMLDTDQIAHVVYTTTHDIPQIDLVFRSGEIVRLMRAAATALRDRLSVHVPLVGTYADAEPTADLYARVLS